MNSTDTLLKQMLTQMKITNVLIAEMTAPERGPRPQWCEEVLAEMAVKLGLDDEQAELPEPSHAD